MITHTEAAAEVERLRAQIAAKDASTNKLVLAAYPAMDAIDAIRKWCDEQQYENDTITVARLREMLPRAKEPCGERHLQPAETCDICGAVARPDAKQAPDETLSAEDQGMIDKAWENYQKAAAATPAREDD